MLRLILFAISVILFPCLSTVTGQTPEASPRPADRDYLIGAGDVLDIRVFNKPQLTRDAVRVDTRGMIRMPLIEEEIQAACRTEATLAQYISARYLKYVRKPQVDVFIREYNSQPVAVVGAVNKPGRFQLQRQVRLLELLAFSGGPTNQAGRTVQVAHAENSEHCENNEAKNETGLNVYELADVLAGQAEANPFVQPGDVVSVLEADQVFVVGNVFRPSSIPIKEPLTVSRAVAMSGGVLPYTKKDRVRIIRQTLGNAPQQEMIVDLSAIEQKQAEDIVLQPNDIVDVPVSGGKRFLGSLIGAVGPAVTQMPVRAIP
ncbi:MAG TPA: polysaccharide biosynthesis/export family protein [Pyrinomonadaceae bacterium]|nr:polysaccharide biosynthesis/export family protein [Pyrinomonadaceae bacterium]